MKQPLLISFQDPFRSNKFLFFISLQILLLLFSSTAFAQGGTCAQIEPFCAGDQALIFPNCNIDDPNCTPTAETGPDYGCLGSEPYPAWFYLQIDDPGNLDFEIVQNTNFDTDGNPTGTGLDVDFIAWGPFNPGDDLCDYSQLQAFNEIACSYSPAPIENFTIPNGMTGELYVLLITNFNQSQGFIKLNQTGGTGSTNCDIVLDCSVDIDGGDQALCGEDSTTLTTTTNGPIESFAWFFNDVLIDGETGDSLVISETGTYKVVVDGVECDVPNEDEVVISISSLGSMSLGEDLTFCDQSSYEIIPEIEGDATGASYLWSTGETTISITVSNSDSYSLEISLNGCTFMDTINLTFLSSPNCTMESMCESIDFEENFGTGLGQVCDLNGAITTYICDSDTTTQVDDNEYTISNTAIGLNNGWHTNLEDHTEGDINGRMLFINAANELGEFYRRTITLNTDTDYTFNAWITTVYDIDTGICPGTGIPSNVIFRIEDPAGGLLEETNTGDIENMSEPLWQEFSINFNTLSNIDVQLVLINNSIGGCGNDLAIDDITLRFESDVPLIEIPEDMALCDIGNDGIEEFDLESQIPSILAGQNSSDFNISFHLSQFDVEFGQLAVGTPSAYPNISNPETIYVRVELVDQPTCYAIVFFELSLLETIELFTNLPDTNELCSTDAFPELDATAINSDIDLSLVTYEWTDESGTILSTNAIYTPTTAGTLTVTLRYPDCSENSYSIIISITPVPTLNLGEDETICEGDSFAIIPTIEGDISGIMYLWSTGETTATIVINDSGIYTLEITTSTCVVSDSITITFSENPDIELGEDFLYCFEESFILDANPSNYNPDEVTYQWFLNGSLITGEINVTYNATQSGTYRVIVSFGDCFTQDQIVIAPREDIDASAGDDLLVCPNEAKTITASTSETNAGYIWFLNDELIPNETNSTLDIIIDENAIGSQTYTVQISVGECIGTASVDVSLYPIGNCVISQGISPNGSPGYNDFLDLEFLNDRTGISNLQIFNRLGTLVFEKGNYVNQWKGQSNDGNDLPTGTYFYVIDLVGEDPIYGNQSSGWIYLNRGDN